MVSNYSRCIRNSKLKNIMYPVKYVNIMILDINNINKLITHPGILIKNITRNNKWYYSDNTYSYRNNYKSSLNSTKFGYFNVECYIVIKHPHKLKHLLDQLVVTTRDILEIID